MQVFMRATLMLQSRSVLITIDPCYFWLTESPPPLVGDASETCKRSGWQPTINVEKPGARNNRGRSLHGALIPSR